MHRTQIYLTDKERKSLKAIAERLGKSQSEVIRSAIDRYIDRYQGSNQLEFLRQGRGLWAKREDLPDFSAVRRELEHD